MAKTRGDAKKHDVDNNEQLLNEYRKVKLPVNENPINTSKYTLLEQIKRFETFSHDARESMILNKEANAI